MPTRTSKWIRKEKRHAIYARDGHTCAYCGCDVIAGSHVSVERAATLDHLVAHHRGGNNGARNLVTACVSCNSSKQDMTMRAWYKELDARGIDTNEVRAEIRRRRNRQINVAAARSRLAA